MQQVLIVIHLIVVVALVGVILLQRSDSGALGIGGGNSSGGFMTGRGQANALTRMTAILATIFFVTSMILAILAGASRQPKSIFDTTAPATAPANPAAPPSGGVLDQLKQLENQNAPK